MSSTTTDWTLKLINEVSAPAKDIQAEIEGVRESFLNVRDNIASFDKETQEAAKHAVQAFEELNQMIEREETRLESLRQRAEQAGDAIDPLTKAQIDLETQQAENKLRRYREQLTETSHELVDLNKQTKETADPMKELFAQMDTFNFAGVNMGFGGITNQIKAMTGAAWGFIKTPLGASIAGLAGIVAITKQFADYNKEAMQFNFVTEQITGLSGRAVDDARVRAKVIEDVYGKSFKDTLSTAQNLVNHFGISMDEAMDHISEGLLRGGHANDSFMKSFGRYGQLFNDAGYNVNEFRRIVNTGIDMGIYENKLPEAIKMFNKNIREQSGATQKAMENALGKKFTDKLFSQVRDGSISPKAALASIADEAERIGVNIQQSQELSSKLFGRAGQDAGGFKNIIEAINTALNKEEEALGGASAAMQRAEERALKLAQAKDNAMISGEMQEALENWNTTWNDFGIWWYENVPGILTGLRKIAEGMKQVSDLSRNLLTLRFGKARRDWQQNARNNYLRDLDVYTQNQENEASKEFQNVLDEIGKNESVDDLKSQMENLKKFTTWGTDNTPKALEAIQRQINKLEGRTSNDDGTNTNLQNDFGISGISGSGGGKVITMNLDIKNFFEVAKNAQADIEEIAEKIIGRVNDRLRDAVITLN